MSVENSDATWHSTTNISSKGCGANMRVQAVGLLPDDEKTRSGIAQFQSALTHAHPTALASADVTAWVIHDLLHEGAITTLLDRCLKYAQSQRHIYHEEWLGRLYQRDYFASDGITYIERGWDEIINILHKVNSALENPSFHADPCLTTGEGWIAEEAFATALYTSLGSVKEANRYWEQMKPEEQAQYSDILFLKDALKWGPRATEAMSDFERSK